MLILITLTLVILVMINLLISKGDWFSPGVLFNLVFMIASFFCILFSDIYNLEFHLNTLIILLMGGITFTLINGFISKLKMKGNTYIHVEYNPYIVISPVVSWIMLFLLILYSMQMVQYVQKVAISYGGSGGLTESIGIYNYYSKFTKELQSASVSRGWFARHLSIPCKCFNYIFMYTEIYNWVNTKKMDLVPIVYIIIYFISSFITGSRDDGLQIISAALIYFIFFLNRKEKRDKVPTRLIFKVGLIFVSVTVGFFAVKPLIGRSSSKALIYTIFPYLGGPLANLDYYLQQSSIRSSSIWGQETFGVLINNLGVLMGKGEWIYLLDLPYCKMNGLTTGNVYTMYYMFVHDFGYLGVIPLTLIIAMYYCYTYKLISHSKKIYSLIDLNLVIYGFLFNNLLMLMFSNKFYENVVRLAFIKNIIGLIIIKFIICNVKMEKGIRLKIKMPDTVVKHRFLRS